MAALTNMPCTPEHATKAVSSSERQNHKHGRRERERVMAASNEGIIGSQASLTAVSSPLLPFPAPLPCPHLRKKLMDSPTPPTSSYVHGRRLPCPLLAVAASFLPSKFDLLLLTMPISDSQGEMANDIPLPPHHSLSTPHAPFC